MKDIISKMDPAKAKSVGGYLLQNHLIALALFIILFVSLDAEIFSVSGVLELALISPFFALIIIIGRFVVHLVHKAVPMWPGLVKLIVDAVLMLIVIGAVPAFLGEFVPDLLMEILIIVTIAAYYFAEVLCLFVAIKNR